MKSKNLTGLVIAIGIVYSLASMLLLDEENFKFTVSIWVVSFAAQASYLLSLIYYHDTLKADIKWRWVFYVLLLPYIGFIHFFLKYRNDLNRITDNVNREMKSNPDSLIEYNYSKKKK